MIRIAAVLAVVAIAVWGVVQASRSDEERIRSLLVDAAEAFDERRVLDCIAAFDTEWVDTSQQPALDRASLQGLLIKTFRRRVDRDTGQFRYRCRLHLDDLAMKIDGEAGRAEVRFVVDLLDALAETEVVWSAEVTAELTRDDHFGWLIRRSTHRTVGGRRPG